MRIRTDQFLDSYELHEELGNGQFAIVRRCVEKSTGKQYAGKFVVKRKPNSNSRKGLFREKILQEVEILGDLKHENIIDLHDVFETPNEIILVVELVTGGELFEYISDKEFLTEEEAAIFIAQILEGVEHFHAKNIVHLDLKPENVMLLDRQSCQIKIIDFGISRKLKPGEKVMETYGTPEFVAPEIIQYQPISSATDMWSIGVITYILLSGASPFLGDTKQETFANITNIDYSFDEEYFGHTSDLAKDFIGRLFVKDVRKRATIKQCLDHPWIKPLRKQDQIQRSEHNVNMTQLKSFIARRRWKQSFRAVLVCNRIIHKSRQLRSSSTLSLENINCVSFGKNLLDNGDDLVLTALHCGAESGDLEYLTELLKTLTELSENTSLNVNKENKNTKRTALHMAASGGHLDIVKLLHQHKVELNALDVNGESAIHYCVRSSNNIESAKQIIEYLVKHGVSRNVQNKNGETALHIASRYGCAELVRCLCLCGADLDLQDDQFENALHVATWHGFPDVVKYLCQFGCDVNQKNKEGESALIVACARGCKESVTVLIDHNADLSCRDKRGNTALHWAVRRHYVHIALMLIQANCKMDVLDLNGETPLHIACRENLLPVVQAMCALGCRVDIKNNKEMTPLHTATEKNEIDAVRCLCLAGLDLGITNKDGKTAEELAIGLKHVNIANLLSSLRRDENREVFTEQLQPTEDPLRRIKIKIFGSSGSGKSTLIDSLKCSYINSFFRKTRLATTGPKSNHHPLKYKKNFVKKIVDSNRQPITRMSTLDLTSSFDDNNSEALSSQQKPNILDNYELVNNSYTKGIKISQCTLNGSNNFSVWEFSGYEPYKLFYDHFIGDQNCIHSVVYNLNQSQEDCFAECVYWLEYLRSRIIANKPRLVGSTCHLPKQRRSSSRSNSVSSMVSSPTQSTSNYSSQDEAMSSRSNTNEFNHSFNYEGYADGTAVASLIQIVFIGTHADLDRSCSKKDQDSPFISEKSTQVRTMLQTYYSNDDLFDLTSNHFALDSRAAWVTDIKRLTDHIVQLKISICERLPRCTMLMNRTLFHLQNWRKDLQSRNNNLNNQDQTSTTNVGSTNNSALSTHSTPTTKYPIISLKHFNARIREFINPLASDEHLNELIQQLQLMGEIVFLEYSHMNEQDHMICFEPEWLCNKILGHLLSYDRYVNIHPDNLNGIYTAGELQKIFANVCSNTRLLKDIFIALDLCAELTHERTGQPVYEFPALNFLSEPMPLAFQSIKSTHQVNSKKSDPVPYVFTGFQLRMSMFHLNLRNGIMSNSIYINDKTRALSDTPTSQLASLFFKIQVNLRHLTKNFYLDVGDDESSNSNGSNLSLDLSLKASSMENIMTTSTSNQRAKLTRQGSKLDTLFETPHISHHMSSNSSVTNRLSLLSQSRQISEPGSLKNLLALGANMASMNGALIDIDLYQTRYCSRLVRSASRLECLVSLDHVNGEFIEVRACGPEAMREELFYFVQDLNTFVQGIVAEICTDNVNIEMHYLDFKKPRLVPDLDNKYAPVNIGVVSYDTILSPLDIINMQFEITKNKPSTSSSSNRLNAKLTNLICCGSEVIEKNVIYGIDLPLGTINTYLARMLSTYLDKVDPMGLDWTILAIVLGLQDMLPKIEELKGISRTACVLNEWVMLKQEQANIRNFLLKIKDLGRKDVSDMMLSTINLFQVNVSKDSGIQNSNQTLASLK